jgi:tRNA/tmRNA/rRNA uracil-C5-methylase (TrmA/RlmC/RlmD family)
MRTAREIVIHVPVSKLKPNPWGLAVGPPLTEAGDLVVDPFCGGGTVPAACQALGRRWLATEIDPEAIAMARKRLAEAGKRLPR